MELHHQPPGSEPGALLVVLQGNIRSASRSCTGLSPLPMACVANNALAECEMVGHLGAAPSISPIRTARIAVFLMPEDVIAVNWWSHGESHPDLRHAMAFLAHPPTATIPFRLLGPAVERWPAGDARPGLAPGRPVLQTGGSTTLPCARLPETWGGRRGSHPDLLVHSQRL